MRPGRGNEQLRRSIMFGEEFLQRAILAAPAIFFALTVHEYFHAWTALRFGDTTARDMGRLTLNPLAHIDPMGLIMMFVSQFRFGWAKPVPVNLFNVRHPRVASFWVSAAGPLSNLAMGLVFGMLFRLVLSGGLSLPDMVGEFLVMFLYTSVMINVSLFFFNMIPLFPLDGSHILRSIMPEEHGSLFDRLDRISPFILLILIITGGFWFVLGPFISMFVYLFAGIHVG